MQTPEQYSSFSTSGFALRMDLSAVVTRVASPKAVHALPVGAVVGDTHGGLTFTDAIAAALESRSLSGWQDIEFPDGETWTVIVVNR
jgi:hypothetical protein